MLGLFESKERSMRDQNEIAMLQNRYGETLVDELKQRANNDELAPRDRRHWQRLLRKAKRS